MSYSSTVLADSPTAYYRMDDTSGTVAHDSSGNGNDAVLTGITSYSQPGALIGDSDTSLLFSGSGGLRLPSVLNLPSFTALTVEFWIKTGASWLYVAATCNNLTSILYVGNDGVLSSSGVVGAGNAVFINQLFDFMGSTQAAYLDEIAVYSTVLSSTRIQAHYLAGGYTSVALFPAISRRVGSFPSIKRRIGPFPGVSRRQSGVPLPQSPYGCTLQSGGNNLPAQRIVEFGNIGVKVLRWQQDLKNIMTAPGVFSWDRLDDAVLQANNAGVAFSLVVQNAADFMTLAYNNVTMTGTLSAVGQTVIAYVNNDAALWQLTLGGTFSSGTQIDVDYSTDGFIWTTAKVFTSAFTYYGDSTGQYFVRVRCAALHSGDSVSVNLICNEGQFTNSQSIHSGANSVQDNVPSICTMFELVFGGTFSSGTQLEIDYSPDGSTWTFFQNVSGPGPITVFGAFPTNFHFLRVQKVSLHSGDSVTIATTAAGPLGSASAKNYMDVAYLLPFAQALAHRYTVGDPANAGGRHIERVEMYNEGGDDGANDILKTPYFIVQALLVCYPAIKAINQSIIVLPGAHLKLVKAHIQTWQQAGYLYGWGPVCDGTNGHYYPGVNPPTFSNPPGQSLDVTFNQYWQTLNAIDVANGYGQNPNGTWKKPVYFTEFGWSRGLEDNFTSNTSANYTSTFNTGGSLGTWSENLAIGQLVGTGGAKAVYYNNTNLSGVFRDGYVEADMTWAEKAGIGTRWVDANNSYYCLINDASSGTNPNTVKLIVRAAGVETTLATASISFTRGTLHTLHLDTEGNGPTVITVQFDGVQIISVPTESTGPQVAGNAFLYEDNGKIQCDTFRMIQAGQVKYSEQANNLVYCYEAGRNSGGVLVELDWFTQSSANSFSTSAFKNNVLTIFPAYTAWQQEIAQYPDWGSGALFPAIGRRTGVLPAVSRRTGVVPTVSRRTGAFPTISRRES